MGYIISIFPFLRFVADFMLEFILLVIEAFASIEVLNIQAAAPSLVMLLSMYSLISAFLSLIIFGKKKLSLSLICIGLIFIIPSAMQPKSYIKVFNDAENVIHIKSQNGKNIIRYSA